LSNCGSGYEPLWQMAVAGRSAIRELSDFSSHGSPIRVGGEIVDFRAEDFVKTKKSLKVMSRDIQLAEDLHHSLCHMLMRRFCRDLGVEPAGKPLE
jgi:hypothetical protein